MLAAAAAFVSCTMDFYRSDTMTSSMLKENPGAAVYTTDGNYAMLKDEISYSNTRSGNEFCRLYFLMNELRGDNASLSNKTTDPMCEDATYQDSENAADLSYMWYISYKIIYGCNSNIESMEEGSVETNHLLGENYFLRAFCHFNLCNLFATPYLRGADKPGVVLRTSTDVSETKRATVGEVYEQIVKDLTEAIRLMDPGYSRGNKGYASHNAARGLLTRVYLYMGENEKCAALADEMLGSDPSGNLDDITTYFANTKDSKETLWCIAKTTTDPYYSPKGELASIYYTSVEGDRGNGDEGWCELYWADPLIDLMMRHPEDKRLTYFVPYGVLNDGKKMVTWPLISDNDMRLQQTIRDLAFDENAEVHATFKFDGKQCSVKSMDINGYPAYYITGLYTDAQDKDDITGGTRCYVRDNVDGILGVRDGVAPKYGMSKFSFQDGHSLLSSPAIIRWAEVVLNRAEANAKLGKDQKALDDVNVIRQRAGLGSDALWTMGNYAAAGYESVLDVVLDERRLELCFEGQRTLDVYRNGKDLDRRYGGYQPYEVITPADMDIRYPYCIPFEETSVSHIDKNQKQN